MTKVQKIALGIGTGAIIVGGVLLYNPADKQLTIDEYQALISGYNTKIQEIKDNCDTDKRCIVKDGEKRVRFENIKEKKDVIKVLDKWVKEDNKKYKK